MVESSRFAVSVHVPKTAGTAVAEVFSRCLNRRIIFDYDGYTSPKKASPLIYENKDFIESYFNVLHGHFYAGKYFEVFPNAAFVATVRHPIGRVISQYMHEFNESSDDAMFHNAIQAGEMDVVEFASQPGVGDAMSVHLEGRDLKDYDLLLISEDLVRSLQVYSNTITDLKLTNHFGNPIILPRANDGASRANTLTFDQKTKEAIFEKTKADNELYAEAVSLLNTKYKSIS